MIYEDKTILERRAIEAKAKYLNAMLTPAEISWAALEEKYEIYYRAAFHLHTDRANKRTEWIKLLGLYYKPFSYIRVGTTDADREALEAAWAEIPSAERKLVEEKAKNMKESSNPLFQYWFEVESVFGFSEDKGKYFKHDAEGYTKKRQFWLEEIGMAVSPYTDKDPSLAKMEKDWTAKGVEEKKVVLRKARERRKRFVMDRKREEEAKTSGNYKPPEKKVTKKKSSGMVYKLYSQGGSYRFGKSNYYGSYNGNYYASGYRRRY